MCLIGDPDFDCVSVKAVTMAAVDAAQFDIRAPGMGCRVGRDKEQGIIGRRLYTTWRQCGGAGERDERSAVDPGLRCPVRSKGIQQSTQTVLSCSYYWFRPFLSDSFLIRFDLVFPQIRRA